MMEKTEKEKMLAGELYDSFVPDLLKERENTRRLTRLYNATTEKETEQRSDILKELLGVAGENLIIEPPFYCDYGYNIFTGSNGYMNFGCVLLDCNTIHIGDNVLMGPYVQIYTAYHPTDPDVRLTGKENALPIKIGNNVWIGGGAIICPRVTIGDNTTIGAGCVVTRNIPANAVVAGNPCRILRRLK